MRAIFRFIQRILQGDRYVDTGDSQSGNSDKRLVRYRGYRNRLDLSSKPLLLLSGATVESARKLIPFLGVSSEMETKLVPLSELIAYNGEEADELHVFANVAYSGSKLSRVLVRDGRIIELTINGRNAP